MNEKMFNKESMDDLEQALKSIISDGDILGGIESGDWYVECHEIQNANGSKPIADVSYGDEKIFQMSITNNGNYTITSLSPEYLKHEMAFVNFFNEVTTGMAISSLDWNIKQACEDIQSNRSVCFYLNREGILKAAPKKEYDAFLEKNPESGFTLLAAMDVNSHNCQVSLTEDGRNTEGNHIAAYFCNEMNQANTPITVLNTDDFTYETPLSFAAPQQKTENYPIMEVPITYQSTTSKKDIFLPLDNYVLDFNKFESVEGLKNNDVYVRIVRDGSDSFQLTTIQPEIWEDELGNEEKVKFVSEVKTIGLDETKDLIEEMLKNSEYPATQLKLIQENGKGINAFEIYNPDLEASKANKKFNDSLDTPVKRTVFNAMMNRNGQEPSVTAEGIYNVTFGEIKGELAIALTDGFHNGKPHLLARAKGACDERSAFHPEEIVYLGGNAEGKKAAEEMGNAIELFNIYACRVNEKIEIPFREAGKPVRTKSDRPIEKEM